MSISDIPKTYRALVQDGEKTSSIQEVSSERLNPGPKDVIVKTEWISQNPTGEFSGAGESERIEWQVEVTGGGEPFLESVRGQGSAVRISLDAGKEPERALGPRDTAKTRSESK